MEIESDPVVAHKADKRLERYSILICYPCIHRNPDRPFRSPIAASSLETGCTPFIEFILGVMSGTLLTQEPTLTSTQEKILSEIRKSPQVAWMGPARIIGISSDGVKYRHRKLTRSEILEREDSARIWGMDDT